ncbi:MAG: calcium-binding protein [Pseudomonadota bacterium]
MTVTITLKDSSQLGSGALFGDSANVDFVAIGTTMVLSFFGQTLTFNTGANFGLTTTDQGSRVDVTGEGFGIGFEFLSTGVYLLQTGTVTGFTVATQVLGETPLEEFMTVSGVSIDGAEINSGLIQLLTSDVVPDVFNILGKDALILNGSAAREVFRENDTDNYGFSLPFAGDDIIRLRQGNDTWAGKDGNDTLFGGGDDDSLWGGNGRDWIYGGTGSDDAEGGAHNDLMSMGSGDDAAYGGSGDDVLRGSSGNDTLSGDGGDDTLNGGNQDDILWGGTGANTLFGGKGADSLSTEGSSALMYGDQGNDRIFGGLERDSLFVGNVEYFLSVFWGNDTIFGGVRGDDLLGDRGNDVLYGGVGNDGLYGGQGSDILRGGTGEDILEGGTGDDTLIGAAQGDFLNGGGGNDTLFGGGGPDTFVYFDAQGDDVIADYQVGLDAIQVDEDAAPVMQVTDDGVLIMLGSASVLVLGVSDTDDLSFA